LHLSPRLIAQGVDNLAGSSIDHISGGRKHILRVNAQGNPAWTVRDLHVSDLFRRRTGGVEHVNVVVHAIGQPDFFLIRRERNPMALSGIVASRFAGWKSLHRDVVKLLAGFYVAHLESENIVGVHECQRIASIHGKGANIA